MGQGFYFYFWRLPSPLRFSHRPYVYTRMGLIYALSEGGERRGGNREGESLSPIHAEGEFIWRRKRDEGGREG